MVSEMFMHQNSLLFHPLVLFFFSFLNGNDCIAEDAEGLPVCSSSQALLSS